MKAAVLKAIGSTPVFDEFETPVLQSEEETYMQVKAAALKNIDKLMTGGKHYAGYKQVPVVVGLDGVGVLEDGTKIYAKGKTGTFAEKAVVLKKDIVQLPNNIEWTTSAALPNAVMGSYLPLKAKGKIKKGQNVLINGGTGITGKLAIQLAKIYGASKVIVSGHTEGRENHLKTLGADECITTNQTDDNFVQNLQQINRDNPIDLVVDYLWGLPAGLIIKALSTIPGDNSIKKPVKIVSVGAMAGDELPLSSNYLRSSKINILGAGFGSYTPEEFKDLNEKVTPQLFQWAAEDKIKIDVISGRLEDIETLWHKNSNGKRIVLQI